MIKSLPVPQLRNILLCAMAALFLAPHVGCAGYQVGGQQFFRNDVRTVHVRIFESDSYRRFLGQRLTESVIKQIELNTPYTLTEPELADSVIRGRIVRETKRSVGDNRFDEPRDIQIAWRVEVTWVDRSDTPLMQLQSLRIDNDENFIPEAGQSLSTAQQNLIERVAREIVGQMELPW